MNKSPRNAVKLLKSLLMVWTGGTFLRDMIRITDYSVEEIKKIYAIADEIGHGKYRDVLKEKTVVMFFPNSSIRTRVTFEKGIDLLGGKTILFPTEALDKREDLKDVIGYLNHWADLVIIRHKDIKVLESISEYANIPVINAMTDENHPCEILSDIYALSKLRTDFLRDKYLFCGVNGNIGKAWKEASEVFGFELEQCCGRGYEMEGLTTYDDAHDAVKGKDIICTDSLPAECLEAFQKCQITKDIMDKANKGAVLNPCPPFYRGEEVSADAIDSEYFVGYDFKKSLLVVQQAIMIYCLINSESS